MKRYRFLIIASLLTLLIVTARLWASGTFNNMTLQTPTLVGAMVGGGANGGSLDNIAFGPSTNTVSGHGVAQGWGLQQNSGAGCATGAVAGNTCTTTLTFSKGEPDAFSSNFCVCVGITSGDPIVSIGTVTSTTVAVTTQTPVAAASQCTTISCLTMHN